jgi:hypothetical protein
MATFTTNFGTNVNGVSVQTGGMVVDVAVRGDRAIKRHLGKRLIPSHRPSAAAPCAAPLAATGQWSERQWMSRSVERSMSRRNSGPAYELPSTAWAALVLARAA